MHPPTLPPTKPQVSPFRSVHPLSKPSTAAKEMTPWKSRFVRDPRIGESAQNAPTLADLGRSKAYTYDAKTGSVYKQYSPTHLEIGNRPLGNPRILVSGLGQINEEPACLPELVERREECTKVYMRIPSLFLTNPESKRQGLCKRSNDLKAYETQIQQDEDLEKLIHKGMHALVAIYDRYRPIVSQGLGNEALELLLCTSIGREAKNIQDTIRRLSCPLKKFQAEYRLAILVEDEGVYESLIEYFFQKLFEKQNTRQRLGLLQFLSEPSPRPLTEDFELFRLKRFYDLIENEELPFEWIEKKALLEAILSFSAQRLAYRLVSRDVFQFWSYWLNFNQTYATLLENPESLECKEELRVFKPAELLLTAFENIQTDLPKQSLLSSLALYRLSLAILKNDISTIQQLAEDLHTCTAAVLPINLQQVDFLIKLYAYASQEAFNMAVFKGLVKLYFFLIDKPENYEKRWEQFRNLGFTILEIAQERKIPKLLGFLSSMLNDLNADLEYKRKIKTYLKGLGANRMEQIETFNAIEKDTRRMLERMLMFSHITVSKKNRIQS